MSKDPFKGRSTEAKSHDWTMPQLQAKVPAGTQLPVTFERQGASGTLLYMMRLRYGSTEIMKDPLNQGFAVERTYTSENGTKPLTTFKAGQMIKVTLKLRNTKERRFVAVTDPIPAGTEPIESWFATTATDIAEQQDKNEQQSGWMSGWGRGGFDNIERHADRGSLFAPGLADGAPDVGY